MRPVGYRSQEQELETIIVTELLAYVHVLLYADQLHFPDPFEVWQNPHDQVL